MRIISKDLLQAGETKSSAGRAYYACDSPTRYSPYASLTCFRTRLTRSTPLLSPATNTQDSGSIVSPGSSTQGEHFSAHTGFSTNAATRANTRTTHAEDSPLGSLETSLHMNELKGRQGLKQESSIHFHRVSSHTAFPFGKPQALSTNLRDYLTSSG